MHTTSIRRILTVQVLAYLAFQLAGCKSTPNPYETPPPTRSVLDITHHVGGTHYCSLVYDGTWYQTFANTLLVLDDRATVRSTESSVIDTIELADFGTKGPAVDMALLGHSLFIVLERDEVVELSLDDPWSPREVRRLTHTQLGVRPMRLSVVNEQLYVSGFGGIVKLAKPGAVVVKPEKKDGAVIMPGVMPVMKIAEDVGRIVMTSQGLATTIGRRIVSVPDQNYLGSANEVIALPASLGGPNLVAYRWVGSEGAVVGLMGPDLRERSRKGFTSDVERVKVIGDTLWIVTDEAIVACTVVDDELVEHHRVPIFGARDVSVLSENYLAVAGSFGRSIYRIEADRYGEGDTFLSTHREASALEHSTYDGRFVLAGSREGFWLYEIERGVTLAERTSMQPIDPNRTVKTVNGTATLDDSGMLLTVNSAGQPYTFAAPPGIHMTCLEVVDGDIWIGHDFGIIILDGTASTATIREQRTLPGPILTLYQLRVGGGATYVSTLGGFGVVRWIKEQIPFEK